MKITVTQKHLERARRSPELPYNQRCLLAQAVKPLFPSEPVWVSLVDIRVGGAGYFLPRQKFSTSKKARRLISSFDDFFGRSDQEGKAGMAKLKSSLPITLSFKEVR